MDHAGSTESAGQTPRRLVRTPDGQISGVAAGIAHYLGLDPTIVRIAFVVLAFAGGVGLLLYAVAWIVMPKGDASDVQPWTPLDGWAVAGVVGLAIGIGLLVGWDKLGDLERAMIAIALVIGGVLLIGRNKEPSALVTPVMAPSPVEAPPATPASTGDWPEQTTVTPPPPATPAQPRGPVTGIVLSLLAIGTGLYIAAAASDWLDVTVAGALAVGLVVIGAGLVVAAVTGGAPWLIVVGSLLVAALIPAAAIGSVIDDGVGDRHYAATTPAELDREYRLGIGDLELDLRDLQLAGTTRTVDVSIGMGSARVIVPPDVDVVIRGHVDVGTLGAPSGTTEDGVDRDLDLVEMVPASNGRLVVHLDVGLGEGVISRG